MIMSMARAWLATFAVLFGTPLQAQAAPASPQGSTARDRPVAVPDVLPKGVQLLLVARWQDLDRTCTRLAGDIASFNVDCARVTGAKVEECARRERELRARLADYDRDVRVFERDLARALRDELEATARRLVTTRALIQQASGRLQDYPAAIEEWSEFADEARRRARHAAAEAAATVCIERLTIRNEAAIRLDVNVLQKIAKQYRSLLASQHVAPIVWEHLGHLETKADVLALVSAAKDALFAGEAVHHGLDREATLSVILKTLGMLNSATTRNPVIGLLIADGELVIADLYAWGAQAVATRRVRQLLDVEEKEFAGLAALTSRYKTDVDRRNKVRKALASLPP